MSKNHELWYAEAERGIDGSSSGFTTVKITSGIPAKLKRHMEQLSCFDTYSPFKNHIRNCLTKCTIGQDSWHVLTRASASTGYSKRAGFFCHHLAIHRSKLPKCNPATLFMGSMFANGWDGKVEELTACRQIDIGRDVPKVCSTWISEFGDAGAAGEMIASVSRRKSVYVPFKNPLLTLNQIEEALSILPVEEMWELTFTTYLSSDAERDLCCIKFFPTPKPSHLTIPEGQIFRIGGSNAEDEGSPPVKAARLGQKLSKSVEESSNVGSQFLPQLAVSQPLNAGFKFDRDNSTDRRFQSSAPAVGAPTMASVATLNVGNNAKVVSSYVAGIIGLIIGLTAALACALPFVFHFKRMNEQEIVLHSETNDQLRIATDSLRIANEKVFELDRSLKNKEADFTNLERDLKNKIDKFEKLAKKMKMLEDRFAELKVLKDNLEIQHTASIAENKKLIDEKQVLERKLDKLNGETELKGKKTMEGIDRALEFEKQPQSSKSNDSGKIADLNASKMPVPKFVENKLFIALGDNPDQESFVVSIDDTIDSLRIVGWPADREIGLSFKSIRKGKGVQLMYDSEKFAEIQYDQSKKTLEFGWLNAKHLLTPPKIQVNAQNLQPGGNPANAPSLVDQNSFNLYEQLKKNLFAISFFSESERGELFMRCEVK